MRALTILFLYSKLVIYPLEEVLRAQYGILRSFHVSTKLNSTEGKTHISQDITPVIVMGHNDGRLWGLGV
jgi:hypothetical protein